MTATALPTRRELTAWRNAVFVVFALSGFAIASWLARVPTIRDALHATTGEMGIVAFGTAVGSIVGLTASSHLISRIGTRSTVRLALGVAAVGLLIAGIGVPAGSILTCFLGLAVFGLGNGTCDVGMNVAGATVERLGTRTVMPLFHASFSLGTVIGVGAGALAEAVHLPVLAHMVIAAVLVAVGALVATRSFRSEEIGVEAQEEQAGGQHVGWRARLSIWRDPRILLIGVVILGMAFTEGSANDWLPLAMVDGHGLSKAGGAWVLSVFLVAMTIGRVLGSPAVDRFGRVAVIRGTAAAAAIGLLLVIVVPSDTAAVVGAVLWGVGASLGFPLGMSAAADDPRTAAAGVSAVATIGYLAFLGGPPLIGFLGEAVGLLHALVVVLVLVVASALAAGAVRPVVRAARQRVTAPETTTGPGSTVP